MPSFSTTIDVTLFVALQAIFDKYGILTIPDRHFAQECEASIFSALEIFNLSTKDGIHQFFLISKCWEIEPMAFHVAKNNNDCRYYRVSQRYGGPYINIILYSGETIMDIEIHYYATYYGLYKDGAFRPPPKLKECFDDMKKFLRFAAKKWRPGHSAEKFSNGDRL